MRNKISFKALQLETNKKISKKYFVNQNANSLIGILARFLDRKEISKVKNHFNQFYKELLDIAYDEDSRGELRRKKSTLKNIYFSYVTQLLIFNPIRIIRDNEVELDLLKDKNFQSILVNEVLTILFFSSDIIFAFAFNNREKYKAILRRFSEMTGKKLPIEKKYILIKIIEKRKELKQLENSNHKFSWKVAISSVYNKLTIEDKNALLQIKNDPPQTLNKNQIKSISQTIAYHQKQGNLPK